MTQLNGSIPIRDLDLSTRAMRALLDEEGLVVVDDVRRLTDAELLALPNFGRKCLKELRGIIGPRVKIHELPAVQTVTIQVFPDLVLTWEPKTGVWEDKVGNHFNLWRVNR